MSRRLALLCALSFPLALFAQESGADEITVTCGHLFGAKRTAERLRDGGFSQQLALEETLNRGEWRNSPMNQIVWVVRIVEEAYAEPGIQSSQVVRECMARAQGAAMPDPVRLPVDFSDRR